MNSNTRRKLNLDLSFVFHKKDVAIFALCRVSILLINYYNYRKLRGSIIYDFEIDRSPVGKGRMRSLHPSGHIHNYKGNNGVQLVSTESLERSSLYGPSIEYAYITYNLVLVQLAEDLVGGATRASEGYSDKVETSGIFLLVSPGTCRHLGDAYSFGYLFISPRDFFADLGCGCQFGGGVGEATLFEQKPHDL